MQHQLTAAGGEGKEGRIAGEQSYRQKHWGSCREGLHALVLFEAQGKNLAGKWRSLDILEALRDAGLRIRKPFLMLQAGAALA